MSLLHIRLLAICVFARAGRILVNEAHDPIDGTVFVAQWRSLDSFGPELPLFPAGLVDLLRSKEAELAG